MMRIVVLGQPGDFGSAWCRRAAARLARRLDLPLIAAREIRPDSGKDSGWITTVTAGMSCDAVLRAADTAVWLHYSPLAVARAWLRGLRGKFSGAPSLPRPSPRMADVRDSLRHMACTAQVHRLLRLPAMTHLQIFHLRNPDETDFWLDIQEHRLAPVQPAMAQAA